MPHRDVKCRMRIIETADGWLKFDDSSPIYLQSWFAGTGVVRMTANVEHAHVFDNMYDCLQAWKFIDRGNPFRPDGLPNRPLTAFTVQPEPVDAEA